MEKKKKQKEKEPIPAEKKEIYKTNCNTMNELALEEKKIWKCKKGKPDYCDPAPNSDFPNILNDNNARNNKVTENDYNGLLNTLPDKLKNAIINSDMEKIEKQNKCYLESELQRLLLSENNELKEDFQNVVYKSEEEHRYYFDHMRYYKTQPCKNELEHDKNNCPSYHCETEARRIVQKSENSKTHKIVWNYYPAKCSGKNCMNKNCKFAHTENEILFHPLFYKTLYCKIHDSHSFINCAYVHVEDTKKEYIRNTLFLYEGIEPGETMFSLATYKTFPCFNKKCEYYNCLRYHNFEEKRRKASTQWYSILCGKLVHNNEILDPNSGVCKNKENCSYAHSIYEIFYHDNLYHTMSCDKYLCELGNECCYALPKNSNEILEKMQEGAKIDHNLRMEPIKSLDSALPIITKLGNEKKDCEKYIDTLFSKIQNWRCCECLELIQCVLYINNKDNKECQHCICEDCYKKFDTEGMRKTCIICGAKKDYLQKIYLPGIINNDD